MKLPELIEITNSEIIIVRNGKEYKNSNIGTYFKKTNLFDLKIERIEIKDQKIYAYVVEQKDKQNGKKDKQNHSEQPNCYFNY